ncbi:MAG: YitT family protein [Sphaerochaetaceae bacterium]|nr:YitT family protein [Sphaerochaetaceae bacterium]
MNPAKNIRNRFMIILGSAVIALGLILFITPAQLASGGVSGIAVILYHLFSIDVGISIFVVSVPIFIAGIKIFGSRFFVISLIGTFLLSGWTSLFGLMFGFEGILDYSDSINVLLSAIFGGFLIGFGTGIVLKGGANTGGIDILAQIISRFTPLSLGTSFFIVDGIVLLLGATVFGIERALFAAIALYVSSISINYVVLNIGTRYAKTALIISDMQQIIAQRINDELGHGATFFDGRGAYTHKERPVIMTVIPNQKVSTLIAIVKECDPSAFMILEEAHEVMGEGFTNLSSRS